MKRRFRLEVLAAGALALMLLVAAACVRVLHPFPGRHVRQHDHGHCLAVGDYNNQATMQTTTVPNPASYTIIFNVDGTTTGKADCNSFTGTWSQQNGFHIQVVPNVMAACGTLDSQYLTLLNQVAAGGPDGADNLALETAGGAQRMLLRTAAPRPRRLQHRRHPVTRSRASSGSG